VSSPATARRSRSSARYLLHQRCRAVGLHQRTHRDIKRSVLTEVLVAIEIHANLSFRIGGHIVSVRRA
jgi:hypothetical protein